METPASEAEMFDTALDFTWVVLIVNVASVLPTGTVMVAGTLAEEELLDKAMTSPPTGAGEVTVTVPVLDFPPTTVVGLTVSDFNVGAFIVSVPV